MRPLRTAIVSGDFPPFISGVGDYVDKLAGALAKTGTAVEVITTTNVDTDARRNFEVHRVVPDWGIRNVSRVLERIGDADVVHIQYPSVQYGRGPMINLLPAILRSTRRDVKVAVTVHDFRVMRRRWRLRMAPMLSSVHGLIYVDPRDFPVMRPWMPFGVPVTACIPIAANAEPVACNPLNREKWRAELGFNADDVVVAFFGILYPHKGLPELIRAVQSIRARRHNVRLLVLGDFDRQASWRAPLETALRQQPVTWVQGASLERISQCLHAADLAALPFHTGASTNRGSLLATLAHGLPTITTRGPATPTDFASTFDVSLVAPQDATALEGAIEELATKSDYAGRMRENALRAMQERTWEAIARKTNDFYHRLTAPRGEEVFDESPQRA